LRNLCSAGCTTFMGLLSDISLFCALQQPQRRGSYIDLPAKRNHYSRMGSAGLLNARFRRVDTHISSES
jgi:hypothetical protein